VDQPRLDIPALLQQNDIPMLSIMSIQVGLPLAQLGLLLVQTTADALIFLMMNSAGVEDHGYIPLI
jgi:hypothetical protein